MPGLTAGKRSAGALLIERLRARDPAAVAQLNERYYQVCYGAALGALGDHHEAEDIAQDAVLKGAERIEQFDRTRGTLRAWMAGIAHKAAVDRRRELGKLLVEEPDDLRRRLEAALGPGEPPGQLSDSTLFALLRTLTSLQAEVLVLRHLLEMSPDEVALALGRSAAAIRQIDSKARRLLAHRYTVLTEGQRHR